MLKLEMMLCVMMFASGRRRLHSSSVKSRVKPPRLRIAASPDWQTPLNGLFHLATNAITRKRQLEELKR